MNTIPRISSGLRASAVDTDGSAAAQARALLARLEQFQTEAKLRLDRVGRSLFEDHAAVGRDLKHAEKMIDDSVERVYALLPEIDNPQLRTLIEQLRVSDFLHREPQPDVGAPALETSPQSALSVLDQSNRDWRTHHRAMIDDLNTMQAEFPRSDMLLYGILKRSKKAIEDLAPFFCRLDESAAKLDEQRRIERDVKSAELYREFQNTDPESLAPKQVLNMLDRAEALRRRYPVDFASDADKEISAITTRLYPVLGKIRYCEVQRQLADQGLALPEPPGEGDAKVVDTVRTAFERLQKFKKLLSFLEQPTLGELLSLDALHERDQIHAFMQDPIDFEMLGEASFALQKNTQSYHLDAKRCLDFDASLAKHIDQSEITQLLHFLSAPSTREGATPSAGKTQPKKNNHGKKHVASSSRNVPAAVDKNETFPLSDVRKSEVYDAITAIAKAKLSKKRSVRLEGAVAERISTMLSTQLTGFARLIGFNTVLRDGGRIRAEFDVVLDRAIVECTLRSHGKTEQIEKRLHNLNNINPMRKVVVLFAPNYDESRLEEIDAKSREPGSARFLFARTFDELDTHLHMLDDEGFAAAAQAAGLVRADASSSLKT